MKSTSQNNFGSTFTFIVLRNLEVVVRLLRVFSHETGDRKELARKKVVAPRSKIRKSDKLFGIFLQKNSLKGFV